MNRRHETRQPQYLIHPVDIPAHQVYEEKPSRIPTFKVDVAGVVVVFFVLAFGFFYSVDARFMPGWAATGTTIIVFYWRVVRVLGDPIAIIKETLFQDVSSKMAPEKRTVQMNRGNQSTEIELRNAKTIRGSKGDYTFSGRQMEQLEGLINDPAGDGKVRRETSSLGSGLSELGVTTGHYPIVYAALKEKGYIGQDDKFTELGKRWAAST